MLKYIFIFFILSFIGCATTPPAPVPLKTQIPGTYLKVEKGLTIWRISRIYNIDLDELIKANNLSGSANIETGQMIFIPQEQKQASSAYKAETEDFIWPVKGKVALAFGQAANDAVNKGINIRPLSDYNVSAARSGKVVFYDAAFPGYGRTIIIDHQDGFSTVYAGNYRALVKAGDTVQKGIRIARLKTDKNSYLHFEIRKQSSAQNPYFYLPL